MFLQTDDLKAMATNHTFLVPTMSVWDAMQYYARAVDWPEARRKRADDLRENSRKSVSTAVSVGVQIALGTDAAEERLDMEESREKPNSWWRRG